MTSKTIPPQAVPPTLDQALQQAVAHHKAGQLQDAERLYRAILQAEPNHPDANHNLGVLAAQLGQYAAALPYLKTALTINPAQGQYSLSYADALLATGQAKGALSILRFAMQHGLNTPETQSLWQRAEAAALKDDAKDLAPTPGEVNEIGALFNAARYVEVEAHARRLIEQYPDSGFAWKALGASLNLQGIDALPELKKATELMPDDAEAHNNLGNAQRGLGQLDDSVASYRRALEIKPDYAEAHCNLGNALKDLGQLDAAVTSYRRALEIKPDYTEAHINLGNPLRDLGQLDDALASYRRALAINPHYAEAHNNLGVALQELGQLDAAVASYRRALEIKPDYAEAHRSLGLTLQSLGQIDGALACFKEAYGLGLSGSRLLAALMLPPIMGTRLEMLTSRTLLEQNVDQLFEVPIQIEDPSTEVGCTNFYLAYHGLNDRDLQRKIAKLYEQVCPSLLYTAPHCTEPRPSGNAKIRIGFLSKFIYSHSVSYCYSRVVEELARHDLFEVALISSHNVDDMKSRSIYSNFAGERVRLPHLLASARETVAALKLDILVYLDIGMDPPSYFMAFSRLARVQCVLGGHPVTTGIGNMDYFLSGDLMEPAGADEHYSEKLIHFPVGIFYFERPTLPARFKTRGELGLPQERHIYMCPMKLQKFHPDFDEAIARILQIDSNGVVVLFDDPQHPSWKAMLSQRFAGTIPAEVRDRILFLPWINDYADFISANAEADVVLDPFHFGIGSTIIATFAVGTPIVTKPGAFLRGRVGMGFCKMMDVMECCADNTEEYARLAVEIATDHGLRDGIKAKILANNHVLYDNRQPIEELAQFFRNVRRESDK